MNLPFELPQPYDHRQFGRDTAGDHVLATDCSEDNRVAIQVSPRTLHIVDYAVGRLRGKQLDGQPVSEKTDLVLEDSRELGSRLSGKAGE